MTGLYETVKTYAQIYIVSSGALNSTGCGKKK